MDNIIKELKLDLGGKEVKLTPAQARRLKEALNELFGEKEFVPYYPYQPYQLWHWQWDTTSNPPVITWSSSDSGMSAIYDSGPGTASLRLR